MWTIVIYAFVRFKTVRGSTSSSNAVANGGRSKMACLKTRIVASLVGVMREAAHIQRHTLTAYTHAAARRKGGGP